MKHILLLLMSICLILGIGITTADPIPNLTGTWVVEKMDCIMFSGEIVRTPIEKDYWNITQQDNMITGTNFFFNGESVVEEPIAGFISPDGKTVNVVDTSGGTYIMYITNDDTLTITYLNTGDKKEDYNYAFAVSEVMKRSV